LSSKEALRELAMEECNSIEKLKVTDDLLKWIQMNGGNLAEFDRICDKVDNAITDKKEDKPNEATTSNTAAEVENGQMLTPVWVIAVAAVASVIGVIIIVVIVIIIVRKRNAAQANLYVQM